MRINRSAAEDLEQLTAALREAIEEHGAPNSFSPGWLYTYYAAPRPTRIGQLMASRFELYVAEDLRVVYLPPQPGKPGAEFRVSEGRPRTELNV